MPIFITPDLGTKSRIVVIFGETRNDLGLVTGRVANGPGGIDEGSMVSVVRAVQSQPSTQADTSPPGIVLANMGQTYWWPEGKRAITISGSSATLLPSLVHKGKRHLPAVNDIPGNKGPVEHVKYMFSEVLGSLTDEKALVDVIATGESCEIVERFLDRTEVWDIWDKRLNSLVLLGPVYDAEGLKNEQFKAFMAKVRRLVHTYKVAVTWLTTYILSEHVDIWSLLSLSAQPWHLLRATRSSESGPWVSHASPLPSQCMLKTFSSEPGLTSCRISST